MTTLSTPAARPAAGDFPPAPPPAPPRVGAICRAMLFKEARELAVPLALIVAGYGAVLAVELRKVATVTDTRYADSSIALFTNFMECGVAAAALAGLLVGFMQFMADSRPHRLGFLTHRPVSRSMIFGCKAVAGIALYFAAMAVPLLAALLWASNPAHIQLPFSWWMALAPLADILSGIPYYFAGILVACRTDARWHGSRLLPAFVPTIASLLDLTASSFSGALLWIAVAAAIIAIAAHGYFTSAGQYPTLRLPARAATGMVLLTGLLMAGVVGVGLIFSLTDSSEPPLPPGYVISRGVKILQDGTPVIEESVSHGWQVRDLSGKMLGTERWNETGSAAFPMLQSISDDLPGLPLPNLLHDPSAYFSATAVRSGGAVWYRPKRRLGAEDYLVGFDQRTFRRVGAIGANGFVPNVAIPPARFGTPLHAAALNWNVPPGVNAANSPWANYARPMSLLAAGDTIYRLLDSGKIETFFTIPNHHPMAQFFVGMIDDPSPSDQPLVSSYVVAVTDEAVTILSAEAEVLVHYEIPGLSQYRVMAGRTVIKGNAAADRFVLVLDRVNPTSRYGYIPAAAIYFTPDGSFDRRLELPEFDNYWPAQMDFVAAYIGAAVAPPAGVGLDLLYNVVNDQHVAQEAALWRRAILLSSVGGVISAAFTFFLARRKRLGLAAVCLWTMLALLAGPAGILLLICLRGLPITIRCATCRYPRPITAELCPHCGAAPAMPAWQGTEIFSASHGGAA